MLVDEIFDGYVQPKDVVHDKVRLEVLFRRIPEHLQRFAQAVRLLAHLVRTQARSQYHEGNLEQDLDAFAQEAVPDAEQRVPREGSGERAQEPVGHVEQRVHLVLLQVPVDRGGGLFEQTVQHGGVPLEHLQARGEVVFEVPGWKGERGKEMDRISKGTTIVRKNMRGSWRIIILFIDQLVFQTFKFW